MLTNIGLIKGTVFDLEGLLPIHKSHSCIFSACALSAKLSSQLEWIPILRFKNLSYPSKLCNRPSQRNYSHFDCHIKVPIWINRHPPVLSPAWSITNLAWVCHSASKTHGTNCGTESIGRFGSWRERRLPMCRLILSHFETAGWKFWKISYLYSFDVRYYWYDKVQYFYFGAMASYRFSMTDWPSVRRFELTTVKLKLLEVNRMTGTNVFSRKFSAVYDRYQRKRKRKNNLHFPRAL